MASSSPAAEQPRDRPHQQQFEPIDRVERVDGLLTTVCCGARIVMISTGAGCEECGATITRDPGETLDLLRTAD